MDSSGPEAVVCREDEVPSHRARRFFTIYVGALYAPHVGRIGIVRTVSRGIYTPCTIILVRSDRCGAF